MSVKLCIICGADISKKLFVAAFCPRCRETVGTIRKAVALVMRAAKIPNATEFPCEDCGRPATEYDHRLYGMPLEVDPVCTRCNVRRGHALDLVDLARARLGIERPTLPAAGDKGVTPRLVDTLANAERDILAAALEAHKHVAARAAKALGITYRAMRYRCDRLGVARRRNG